MKQSTLRILLSVAAGILFSTFSTIFSGNLRTESVTGNVLDFFGAALLFSVVMNFSLKRTLR